MRRFDFLALVVVAAAFNACVGPSVNIITLKPTDQLEPRGADRLLLVDGEGRKTAKEEVAALLKDAARGGFFHVDDRGDEGVKLTLVGKEGKFEGSDKGPRKDELLVRIDVLTWEATPFVIKQETTDKDGRETIVDVPALQGHADLQISMARPNGEIVMREQEFRGLHEVELLPDQPVIPEAVIAEAARNALTSFLVVITPVRTTDLVAFDQGDNGQDKILAMVKDHPLKDVERKLRVYVKKNEGNAIALFNLGVTLDAQGKFEEAIQCYDKAMKIAVREGYVQARGGAVARLAAWERIYGPREKQKKEEAKTASASPSAPPAP